MSTLAILVTVLALIFGGGGAAVFAAEDSRPGQPLYPLKLTTEDLRLSITQDPPARLELALAFAARRSQELKYAQQSAFQGASADAAFRLNALEAANQAALRFNQQLELALEAAAGLPDGELPGALERLRAALGTQEGLLARVRQQVEAAGDQPAWTGAADGLASCQERVQARLRLVQLGQTDPATFRLRLRSGQPESPAGTPTGAGGGYGPGPCDDCTATPGSGYGPGPFVTGTPTPGSGPGPGPGPCDGCTATPGSGYGPGPFVTGTPTPGSGPGPGPGPCNDCTPTPGAGYGPGPGPQTDPGQSGQPTTAPGGNPQAPGNGEPQSGGNPDNGGGSGSGGNPDNGGGSGGGNGGNGGGGG